MTKSLIGPNAAIRYLKDYHGHVNYWQGVNPAYALAYVDKREHAPYIQEYAAEFPNSMVVARIHHPLDGGFHLPAENGEHYVATPQNYHNDLGWLGRTNNIILNVFNEPDGKADSPTIERLVDWFTEYIPIAAQNKTKSVLFNWGKMQPRIIGGRMDARFAEPLKIASLYPDLFWLGLHFYGPESVTEILQGYIALCAQIGIKPLRVIGTEWGNDDHLHGSEAAAWEIGQIKRELAPFIESGVVVGFNRFQDGNSGGWEGYATEDDKPYKDEIRRAAKAGEIAAPDKRITWTVPVVTAPQPAPIPVVPPAPSAPAVTAPTAQITQLESWRDELAAEIAKLTNRKAAVESLISLAKGSAA